MDDPMLVRITSNMIKSSNDICVIGLENYVRGHAQMTSALGGGKG